VSFLGQRFGKFYWDDLMFEKGYGISKAYNQSKIGLVTFTKELEKRLKGTQVKTLVLNPGPTRTDGFRRVNDTMLLARVARIMFKPFILYFAKTSRQGAQTSLYCTMEDFDKLVDGGYYSDCKSTSVNHLAEEEDNQKQLWEVSEGILRDRLGEQCL